MTMLWDRSGLSGREEVAGGGGGGGGGGAEALLALSALK